MLRPHRRICLLCLPLLLLALTATVPALAQTEQELADLKALFEKDPAEGFVQAAKLFEVPRKIGDLEGMMKVLKLTCSWAAKCCYAAVAEDMIDGVLPVARDTGNWQALGDLYAARQFIAQNVLTSGPSLCRTYAELRQVRYFEAAREAYARGGGKPSPEFENCRWCYPVHARRAPEAREATRRSRLAQWGPELTALTNDMEDAVAEGRDADALNLLGQMLGRLQQPPLTGAKRDVTIVVAQFVWLRGGERLLPGLRPLIGAEPTASGGTPVLHDALLQSCLLGWSGRDDTYRRSLQWLWDDLLQTPRYNCNPVSRLLLKMDLFMRTAELNRLAREFVGRAQWHDWAGQSYLKDTISGAMEPELRETLLGAVLGDRLQTMQGNMGSVAGPSGWGGTFWNWITKAEPPRGIQWWGEWMAREMVAAARELGKLDDRVFVTNEAASLFDLAGRPDLSSEARALAKAMASGDPVVLLQCAVASAWVAAKEKKWAEVRSGLEPALAKQKPSSALLQACLLLQQACAALGDAAKAAEYLTQAGGLVGKVGLSATERANTLVQIAGLTTKQPQRVSYLQQAQAAAKEAGLDLLSEKIDGQLTEAALSSGDHPAAEKALLQQINRLEAKRDQLAFDRLLRQQWFADNLGPYRQLLRVAAQEGKAPLALWVGEKMRGRALADQLAWQKVDLGVKLPPAMRTRLEGLRQARRETYALLQQVMGGGAVDDTRGAYMPIRGAYLPIRGGLSDQPATTADIKQLRSRIDSLAREEAAIAAAIRESIPAYAEASDTKTLSGTELVALVARQPDLAVLQYTLCEEGVVVVALGPGQPPQVALLPVPGEALWQQIGEFRQQVWERKAEADAAGGKLFELLVKPVAGSLTNAKRLWVVADGALQLLPFVALRDADGQYLAQRLAVANSPSLSLTFADFGQRVPGSGALIFTAPDTGATPVSETDDKRGAYLPIRGMYIPVRGAYLPIRGEGVSSALMMMANVPLPGAQAEGEALAAKLPKATLLTGKEATRTKLLEQGSQCDLLHIATHGYADPETPEFSGLLLAGESTEPYDTLTAQEVYMWGLKARLVTLSACQTALGQTVAGEGVLGLTRAFLYAGAQDVLCTLWPVADESTKTLMTAFYDKLQAGTPMETALQQAQLSLLGNEATQAPFYWAGFTAVRGPE